MHSKDLQHGVPYEFNNILDELLDGVNPSPMMNEEEYNRQMNLSLSQIPPETPSRAGGDQDVENGIQERLLTEVEEGKELSTPHGSSHYESNSSKANSKKTEKANHDYPSDLPVGSPGANYARGVSNLTSEICCILSNPDFVPVSLACHCKAQKQEECVVWHKRG